MIEASHLSRFYGKTQAVKDLSFLVNPGEIVGFLGPNGAGKSTTLRMLAGILPPSSGVAYIGGKDVQLEPVSAKLQLGYLPENCPLYPEMRVSEYLRFRGSLKGLKGAKLKTRLDDALSTLDLARYASHLISSLSKGTRQRVGIADALIGDPNVLILDEPTSGLDPNQIRDVRALVKSFAGQKAVLWSTHILQEAEAIATRLLILSGGSIVFAGTVEQLHAHQNSSSSVAIRMRLQIDDEPLQRVSNDLGFAWTHEANPAWIAFHKEGDADSLAAELSRSLILAGANIFEMQTETRSLEDVFAQLTQSQVVEASSLEHA